MLLLRTSGLYQSNQDFHSLNKQEGMLLTSVNFAYIALSPFHEIVLNQIFDVLKQHRTLGEDLNLRSTWPIRSFQVTRSRWPFVIIFRHPYAPVTHATDL